MQILNKRAISSVARYLLCNCILGQRYVKKQHVFYYVIIVIVCLYYMVIIIIVFSHWFSSRRRDRGSSPSYRTVYATSLTFRFTRNSTSSELWWLTRSLCSAPNLIGCVLFLIFVVSHHVCIYSFHNVEEMFYIIYYIIL